MIYFKKNQKVKHMKRCKKKPIVVHCLQIKEAFTVETMEGKLVGNPGDFLMQGVDGELYPCAKEIFLKSYDILD